MVAMHGADEVIRVRKKKRKHSRAKKVVIITLVALVCVFGLAGTAAALYVNSLNSAMAPQESEAEGLKSALVPQDTQDAPYYALIIGSDRRDIAGMASHADGERSDILMLARIDSAHGQVTLVSIPRDTKVTLNGQTQKINQAFWEGGSAEAVATVSEFAGVPIAHYVEVSFAGIEQLVDTLGGVWVDVPVGFESSGRTIESGNQLLNGEQTLMLARERMLLEGGDYDRTQNQRAIVMAIMKQVLAAPVSDLPGIVQETASSLMTDYSVQDLVTLAQKFNAAGSMTLYTGSVPFHHEDINELWFAVTDEPNWTVMMENVSKGLDPYAGTTKSGTTTVLPAGTTGKTDSAS